MAKKISQLSDAGALAGSELLEIVQSGISKKVSAQDIANLATGGSSPMAFKGGYAMGTTNDYPTGGNSGYLYVTTSATSRTINGAPIPVGTLLLCIQDSASSTNDAHWKAIYTL